MSTDRIPAGINVQHLGDLARGRSGWDWKATMADMKNEKDLPLRAKAKGGDEFIYNSLFLQLLISLFDVIDFTWTEMTQNVPEI